MSLISAITPILAFTILTVSWSNACETSATPLLANLVNESDQNSPMVDPSSNYPKEWWAEFPEDQKESWEILPQEAGPGEVILSKRTELGILSNFAATPFELDGHRYASLEGFWQMMKFPDSAIENDPRNDSSINWPMSRNEVANLVSFDAKKAGDFGSQVMKTLQIDFVSYLGNKMVYRQQGESEFYQLIVRATRAKIAQNPEVKRILLATGDLKLRPDHLEDPNGALAWKYYQIYMKLRTELKLVPLCVRPPDGRLHP